MAYSTGTANTLEDLRTALINACTAEGWTWDAGNEVLHKTPLFLRIQIGAKGLIFLGRTGLTSGGAPRTVRMGDLLNVSGNPTYEITFPAVWRAFVFSDEVYFVVNYDVDRHQWCAFGQSTVPGLPGSGMWIAATGGYASSNQYNASAPFGITATGGAEGHNNKVTGALFWSTDPGFSAPGRNFFVHSDLDGDGWYTANASPTDSSGPAISALVPLIGLLPNAWNSEAVLLPVRAYKRRPENRISLIVDLEHARHTRVDNYTAGQIITIGSDRWMTFPYHRKNTRVRNGGALIAGIDHTGTFGWAIRYEGP